MPSYKTLDGEQQKTVYCSSLTVRQRNVAIGLATVCFLVILALTLGLTLSASKSLNIPHGDVMRENRTLNASSFGRITVHGPMSVSVFLGAVQAIVVEADSTVMPFVNTFLGPSNLTPELVVQLNDSSPCQIYGKYLCDIHLNVTTTNATELNEIHLTGSGSIKVHPTLNITSLVLRNSGSGSVVASSVFASNSVRVGLSGSGEIKVSGSTNKANLTLSGSGSFYGLDLQTTGVVAVMSGSGNGEISVSSQLKATLTGSGSLRYRGNPPTESVLSTGTGRVIHV
ncbi:hypothetical protein BV898_05312 [Hypsibius exemplaris]|uniref:Putative auto-transporter adhesin head GIN domain-containing protein n=1 Tax=Hypsibius exemplaris TaxID=2072580 RepID=A0A1W0WZU3_HYPEX|nr:hypothetical protein BV898_05312 [Hypsibius exemplaris]